MATYKVIQDIEAEDHILGPLSLRQFIYALISIFMLYICFLCLTKGVGFLLVIFLPPAIFAGFFAFPFGKDQPTEIWALAKIRFLFKPRRRIWDQSGIKELVTITVPKRVERMLTNGLSQNEVESRLKALASTIDSRGWSIKNVNVNLYNQPGPLAAVASDRLIDMSAIPQQVPDYDIQASDDILDETSNPIAQHFDQMIAASGQAHRKQLLQQLDNTPPKEGAQKPPVTPGAQPADYWFLNQATPPTNLAADQAMFASAQVVQPGVDEQPVATEAAPVDEAALTEELKARSLVANQQPSYAHLRTIQPLNAQHPEPPSVTEAAVQTDSNPVMPAVTAPLDPAILSLANNNDLNVATLAREAYKAKNPDEPPQDEVVISLR